MTTKILAKEAIEVLIKEMSDGDPDIAIMVAGGFERNGGVFE